MPIKTYKTSPAKRHMSVSKFEGVTKKKPENLLLLLQRVSRAKLPRTYNGTS